jgi:hypothetical protein
MAKVKKNPFALGASKTPNPLKEMSWCHSRHITVITDLESFINDRGYYEMTMRYGIIVRQGNREKKSGYIYTRDNVVDAIYDAYRHIYNNNYVKERQESGD